MSKALEVEITKALNADAVFTDAVGTVYLSQPPRAVKAPIVVCQLVGDPNTKHTLARYGGEALLQFDLYGKTYDDTAVLRDELKDALRRIRGSVGDLVNVYAVVSNEVSQGLEEGGLWRWTVDATVTWEE